MAELAYSNELQDQFLNGFKGKVVPTPVPWTYRIGLGFVALFMVILPLLYLAIVALFAWAAYWYAVDFGPGLFDSNLGGYRANKWRLLLYVTPLVVSSLLIVFMVKPIFVSLPQDDEQPPLEPEKEPILFAFVRRLCTTMGAPIPSVIAINNEVNASAGPRSGLFSLLRKDLKLTIGLPLVAGLNANQFAGVLAHEFGHFSQLSGMTLTYLIRSINFWFYRVVYERDRVDLWLDEQIEGTEGWMQVTLMLGKGGVWISRRVLWLLMITGSAISNFMLRQMEFDADSYEAKLVGGSTFASTAKELIKLSASADLAIQDQRSYWANGKLCGDHSRLVSHHHTKQNKQLEQVAQEHISTSKTKFFDTHPCDMQRIQQAHQHGQNRVFNIDMPATVLFRDFKELSENHTKQAMSEMIGRTLDEQVFRSIDELKKDEAIQDARFKAMHRVFRLNHIYGRWTQVSIKKTSDVKDIASLKQEYMQLRDQISANDSERFETLRQWQSTKQIQQSLRRLHESSKIVKSEPAWFGLATIDPKKLPDKIQETKSRLQELKTKLDTFDSQIEQATSLCLWLANQPKFANNLTSTLQSDAFAFLELLHQQSTALDEVESICTELIALLIAVSNTNDESLGKPIMFCNKQLVDKAGDVLTKFSACKIPIEHTDQSMDVAAYVSGAGFDREDPVQSVKSAESMLRTLWQLSNHSLASLATTIEDVEKVLGLPNNSDIDHKIIERLFG